MLKVKIDLWRISDTTKYIKDIAEATLNKIKQLHKTDTGDIIQ